MLSLYSLEKIVYFCLAGLLFAGTNVLVALGYKSEMISTTKFLNVHPAIWVLLCIALFLFIKGKKPFLMGKSILVFLAVLVSFNKLTGRGVDFSFLLNVLILPLVVSYIFSYSSLIDKGKVQNIILDFFIIECFLAIIEKVLNFNLFPLVSNGSISDWTWEGFRSTAFQSHPLSNALIVSTLMNFILCSSLPMKKRYSYWLLGLISLLCFNTRSSMVGCCLLFGVFALKKILSRGIGNKEKIILLACLCVFPIAVFVLLGYGLGNRLLELGLFDDSSAVVRVKIFEIFDFYQLKDFILGYSSESIDDILFVSGLSSYCIENYWLVYILKFGIVFTILIAYFYGSFFIRLLQRTSSFHKMFLLGSFLLISSTNNLLATDSIALSVLTLCCYCLPPMKIS